MPELRKEKADLKTTSNEAHPETNTIKALRSILSDAKRIKQGFPIERSEGVRPLEAEARALDRQQEPALIPDRAFALIEAIWFLQGANYSDQTTVQDFVFRSLQAGWPANAEELTDAVLKHRNGFPYWFDRLPPDLPGHRRLTAAMTERLLSGPSCYDMNAVKILRFGP